MVSNSSFVHTYFEGTFPATPWKHLCLSHGNSFSDGAMKVAAKHDLKYRQTDSFNCASIFTERVIRITAFTCSKHCIDCSCELV